MSGFNDRRGTNPNFGFSTMSEEYRLDKEELTARYRDILNSTQGVGEREVKQLPGVDALMGSDPSSGKREVDQLSGVVAPKGGDSNSGDSEGEQLSGVDASKGSDPSLGKSEVEQLSGVDAPKGSDPNSGDSEGEQLSGVDASKGGDPSSGKREVERLSGVDAPKGSDPNSGDSEGEQLSGVDASKGSDPSSGKSEVEQLSGVDASKGSDPNSGNNEVGQLSGVDAPKGSDPSSGKSEDGQLSGVDAPKGSDPNSGKCEVGQLSGVDAQKRSDPNSGKSEVAQLSGVDAPKGSDPNSAQGVEKSTEQYNGRPAPVGSDPIYPFPTQSPSVDISFADSQGNGDLSEDDGANGCDPFFKDAFGIVVEKSTEQYFGRPAPVGSDPIYPFPTQSPSVDISVGSFQGNGGLSEDHGANGCDPFFKDAFGIVVEKSTEQYFGRPAPVGSDPIYPFPTQSPSVDISFGGFQGNSEVEQLSGVVALKGSDLVCEVGQLSGVDASKGSDLNSGKSEVERLSRVDASKGSDLNSGKSEVERLSGVDASKGSGLNSGKREVERLSGVDASKGSDLNSGKREIEQLSGVDASKGIDLNSGKGDVERSSGVDASKGSDLNSGKREIEQLSGVDASKGIDLNSGKGEVEPLSGVDASKGSDLNSGKREIEQLFDVHASKGSDLNSGKSEVGQLSGVDAPKGHSAQGVENSEVGQLPGHDATMRRDLNDSSTSSSFEHWQHNKDVLDRLKAGDMLHVDHELHSHCGIYVGNSEVVHLSRVDGAERSGVYDDKLNVIVRKDDFWKVVGGSKVHSVNAKDRELDPLESSEIVARALSETGKKGDDVIFECCEHFASWCRYNTAENSRKHNQNVLDNLEPGDLLEFKRGVYSHWAVYIGNSKIVHLSGVDGAGGSDLKHPRTTCGVETDKGIVRQDNFWTVAGYNKAYKNNSKDSQFRPLTPSRIVQRALSKVGKVGYNLLYKNCEHFATWCRYGKEESDQAKRLFAAVAVVVGAAAVVLTALFGRG